VRSAALVSRCRRSKVLQTGRGKRRYLVREFRRSAPAKETLFQTVPPSLSPRPVRLPSELNCSTHTAEQDFSSTGLKSTATTG
jgi:hypothetical protein